MLPLYLATKTCAWMSAQDGDGSDAPEPYVGAVLRNSAAWPAAVSWLTGVKGTALCTRSPRVTIPADFLARARTGAVVANVAPVCRSEAIQTLAHRGKPSGGLDAVARQLQAGDCGEDLDQPHFGFLTGWLASHCTSSSIAFCNSSRRATMCFHCPPRTPPASTPPPPCPAPGSAFDRQARYATARSPSADRCFWCCP